MEVDSCADCLQLPEGEVRSQNVGVKVGREQEDYRTLKIATHNINGIKGSSIKIELLLEWASKEKIDMIGINETNTTEIQSRHRLKN